MFVEAGVPMDWCVNPSETKINLGSSSMMVETKMIGITSQVSYMCIIYLIIWLLYIYIINNNNNLSVMFMINHWLQSIGLVIIYIYILVVWSISITSHWWWPTNPVWWLAPPFLLSPIFIHFPDHDFGYSYIFYLYFVPWKSNIFPSDSTLATSCDRRLGAKCLKRWATSPSPSALWSTARPPRCLDLIGPFGGHEKHPRSTNHLEAMILNIYQIYG